MQSSSMTPTYTDFSEFDAMRAQARLDPQSSLKKVAKQFESIFIQMMLKSMRQASMGDPIFDSDESKFYRDMFDQQIALDMANSKGIGIADAMVRQLERHVPQSNTQNNTENSDTKSTIPLQSKVKGVLIHGKILPLTLLRMKSVDQSTVNGLSRNELPALKPMAGKSSFKTPEEFTRYILPYAEKAAEELGVSPLVLVAQSALETGWGKSITQHRDGRSSFNLFNIKADSRWQGDTVIKSTLEYENGKAKYEKSAFRAYDSYADSFDDYIDFLRTNSRYSDALRHKGNDQIFIKDLHKAGYATDPDYANKVLDILKRDSIQVHAKSQTKSDAGKLNVHV